MKLCPNCNTQNADVYTQCVGCGAVLPSAPPQPIYSGNPGYSGYVSPSQMEPVTSAIGWLGWYLLCGYLAIIGPIIMMNITKDPTAKNYAKLMLILQIIGVVLGVVLALVFGFVMANSVSHSYYY